jgi:SAM-dependent methyltransferase
MNTCRICGNANLNKIHTAREMMYGLRDEFEYLECNNCDCLQIVSIPTNLGDYYPSDYLSFSNLQTSHLANESFLRKLLKKQRTRYMLGNKNIIGFLVSKIGPDYFEYDWSWFSNTNVTLDSKILDVGCGIGKLLRALQNVGFEKLYGVDPFIDKDIEFGKVKIHKKELEDIEGTFDLVMMHHSFEHMLDSKASIKAASNLLKPGGSLLIRIPVLGYPWRKYGVNWFGLDAPRHLYLHTKKSIKLLAEAAGLELIDIRYDDQTGNHFWGSAQYSQDIPAIDPRSHWRGNGSVFSDFEMQRFMKEMRDKNIASDGGQAAFYLYKPK